MATPKTETKNYYKLVSDQCPLLTRYSRNLSLLYMEDKLDPCYNRDGTIIQIQKLLLRKNKANILLTGPAGCGKTAIAEGLAAVITQRKLAYEEECAKAKRAHNTAKKKWEKLVEEGATDDPPPKYVAPIKPILCDLVIFDLSVNAMVGGTKYRGEFEERVQDILRECRKQPNVILFIDEFHHINTVGASEGSVSAGQLLKPALARSDIRVIGATTTDEKSIITKDKALARRFSEIEITQLEGNVAEETAKKILEDYCRFHKITTSVAAIDLRAQVNCFLSGTVFPDNYINVVDETLASAAFDGLRSVDMTHFDKVLSRITGKVILSFNTTGDASGRSAS